MKQKTEHTAKTGSRVDEQTLQFQRDYFHTRRPPTMLAADTPYVHRHFQEVAAAAGFTPGQSVCEWGAGLGRFSRHVAGTGVDLEAIELSPTQGQECAEAIAGFPNCSVVVGDIAKVLEERAAQYDTIVGFFMLHHLEHLDTYFAAAANALKPGGRLVFTEPNPWNPLYPLQITLTPGMRWRAEKGIYSLWPKSVQRLLTNAGFEQPHISYYGALPRAPYNAAAKLGLHKLPEYLTPPVLKPFQVITATKAQPDL